MVQHTTMYFSFLVSMSDIFWWQGSNLLCHQVWFNTMALAHNKSINVDCQNAYFFLPVCCAASYFNRYIVKGLIIVGVSLPRI